jgi:glycosyltransferase involved in cell wall biosynthesis
MSKTPKVSIGLPVFNGEEYLEKSLDAILCQTFKDFELIISDNGSTDRTPEICKQYAERDPRIVLFRVEDNHGAAWNFNHVFELARADYFKWASHDDLLAPSFLERCVQVLDTNPDVVIVYSRTDIIDANEQKIETYPVHLNTGSTDPLERFYDLLLKWHLCIEIFGLIRKSTLQQTSLIGNYAHGDGILLERLAFLGRFYEISDILFYSRKHARQSMNIFGVYRQGYNDYHNYTFWFDPAKAGKILLPAWRMLHERVVTLKQARLRPKQRLIGYLYLGRWVIRHRTPLLLDLLLAVGRMVIKAAMQLRFGSRYPIIDENRIRQSTH